MGVGEISKRGLMALGASESNALSNVRSTLRKLPCKTPCPGDWKSSKISSFWKARGRCRPSEGNPPQPLHPCISLLCKTGKQCWEGLTPEP